MKVKLAVVTFLLAAAFSLGAVTGPVPVRGIHLRVVKPDEIPMAVEFIRDVLRKEGVNVLVLEVGYNYQFQKHPEVTDPNPLSREDLQR